MDPFIPTPATTPARRGTSIRAQAVRAGVVIVVAVVAALGTTWAKSGEGSTQERNKPQSATTRPAEPRTVARRTVAGVQSGTDAITDATPQAAAYKVKAERPARKSDGAGHSGATEELLHDTPAVAVADQMQTPVPAAPRRVRSLRMQVTAYCPCPKCCGPSAKGLTASGLPVTHDGGAFVAADTAVLPFGTRLAIPGYHGGRPVEVIDRGGAIRGSRLDVFFPTHQEALEWGRQWVTVNVVE